MEKFTTPFSDPCADHVPTSPSGSGKVTGSEPGFKPATGGFAPQVIRDGSVIPAKPKDHTLGGDFKWGTSN